MAGCNHKILAVARIYGVVSYPNPKDRLKNTIVARLHLRACSIVEGFLRLSVSFSVRISASTVHVAAGKILQ
jgi:hypothetical protein